MQTIHEEMIDEGHDFHVMIINVKNEEALIGNLTGQCSFPVFQDVDSVNAWLMYYGVKDDIYVYTADHVLHSYLSPFGTTVTVLTSDVGKQNLKDAIIAAEAGL